MGPDSNGKRLCRKVVGFSRNRRANISTIFAILAVPMTLAAGGAIDVAMQEHDRIRLQNALDTSLIAAASISQTMPAEQTIRSYLDAAQISGYTLTVDETKSVSARTVTATATIVNNTNFLRLIDIPTLDVVARGTAEEAYQNIELSLVLDLSGSMKDGNRITAMRPAAKNFISQLLAEQTKPFTTISLVPYAGQVSVGKAVFDAFGGTRTHDKSSCFGNLDKKYVVPMGDFSKAEHVPQFSTWVKGKNVGFDPWNCPTEETSITFYSNDVTTLHKAIDGYHMFDGTATHIATKWGLFLLDPVIKTTLATAKKNGVDLMPAAFSGRPAAFGDSKTLKIMVIMTDGEVVAQQRPNTGKAVNEQPATDDEKNKQNVQKVGAGEAIIAMNAACEEAKKNGVTVYAIGYDVSDTYKPKLKTCASGESRYYDATSSNINKIFQDVALSIYPLRLTH